MNRTLNLIQWIRSDEAVVEEEYDKARRQVRAQIDRLNRGDLSTGDSTHQPSPANPFPQLREPLH